MLSYASFIVKSEFRTWSDLTKKAAMARALIINCPCWYTLSCCCFLLSIINWIMVNKTLAGKVKLYIRIIQILRFLHLFPAEWIWSGGIPGAAASVRSVGHRENYVRTSGQISIFEIIKAIWPPVEFQVLYISAFRRIAAGLYSDSLTVFKPYFGFWEQRRAYRIFIAARGHTG